MKLLFAMLLISCSPVIQAEGYFTSRMYTPYPPGCVTLPSSQEALYGDNIFKFWRKYDVSIGDKVEVVGFRNCIRERH
jgi:hypothetical protein